MRKQKGLNLPAQRLQCFETTIIGHLHPQKPYAHAYNCILPLNRQQLVYLQTNKLKIFLCIEIRENTGTMFGTKKLV